MDLWQLLLIVGTLIAVLIAFIWVALRLSLVSKSSGISPKDTAAASVNVAVNQAFTEEFQEELRQRARQQFDKVMQDNAMFLQQDIRVGAAQLNELMKQEIVDTLQEELGKHSAQLDQTRQMVTETLTKNQQDLHKDMSAEKERRIKYLDDHMTDIVKAYVMAAVGETIDVDKQLALVIDNLNAHKAEIIEDIRRDG